MGLNTAAYAMATVWCVEYGERCVAANEQGKEVVVRALIKMDWQKHLLTRDLSDKDLAALLCALDGAAIVEGKGYGPDEQFAYASSNNEPEIVFISTVSPRLPEKSLRDHVRETLVAEAHKKAAEIAPVAPTSTSDGGTEKELGLPDIPF